MAYGEGISLLWLSLFPIQAGETSWGPSTLQVTARQGWACILNEFALVLVA